MKQTHARKRSKKMAVAFGAVLVTAGCATATTQITDTEVGQGSRYDGGVEQLLLYCGKLRDNGELPTAASICERAYNVDPTDPRPLIMLGEILTEMGRLPQAASAYLVLLEQTPHNVEARYLLGKTYIAMGRHDLALQELQFALTQSPEDARIYNALGIANGMLGNQAAARQAFEDGLKVAPDDVPLQNNLGLALVLDGKHEEGIALLQKVALNPAANATTIRNLQLAEGIAQTANANQSANANQTVADTSPAEDTVETSAKPGGASQLASTATVPSDFSPTFSPETEPIMPEAAPEATPEATTETPKTATTSSQPLPVPREPVTLTEALSPLANDIQLADGGMPVYLDSDSSTGKPKTFAAIAEKQDDSMDTPAEEPNLASTPKPILAPETEQPSGEMQEIVTANINTDTSLKTTPSGPHTAALEGENIYSVQLASYRSADRAQTGWRQIRASALDLLEDVEPVIRRSDLGPERGIYFRLRTKPASKDTANQLCSALQARGLSCLTIKESPDAAIATPDAPAAPAATEETTVPTAVKS